MPNKLQGPLDEVFVLEKVAQASRHFGKIPTFDGMALYRRQFDPNFPSDVSQRFRRADLLERLTHWVSDKAELADVPAMLPKVAGPEKPPSADRQREGFVYLMRSGTHFKIGRSDEIERRVKEITVALPETATLVHTIRTDDPPGIEAYWHRRFADRRANGECLN